MQTEEVLIQFLQWQIKATQELINDLIKIREDFSKDSPPTSVENPSFVYILWETKFDRHQLGVFSTIQRAKRYLAGHPDLDWSGETTFDLGETKLDSGEIEIVDTYYCNGEDPNAWYWRSEREDD